MLHACRIWNKVSSGLQKAFSHRTIRSVMHQDITPGNMQTRFVPLYKALSGHIALETMLHACRIWNKISSGLQKAFSHRTIRSVMHQDINPGNMQKRFVPLYNSNKDTIRPYCARNYVARMPNLEQGQFRSPKGLQSQNHQVCDASRHHSRKHAKALCTTL